MSGQPVMLLIKKQYDDFKTIWEESKRLASGSKVDENAAWQRFKNRVEQTPQRVAPVKRMQLQAWMKVAALFIIIAGMAWLGYRILSDKPVENLVVASQQNSLVDTLPDGSVVTLNKNSSINYPSKFKGDTSTVSRSATFTFSVGLNSTVLFLCVTCTTPVSTITSVIPLAS